MQTMHTSRIRDFAVLRCEINRKGKFEPTPANDVIEEGVLLLHIELRQRKDSLFVRASIDVIFLELFSRGAIQVCTAE